MLKFFLIYDQDAFILTTVHVNQNQRSFQGATVLLVPVPTFRDQDRTAKRFSVYIYFYWGYFQNTISL